MSKVYIMVSIGDNERLSLPLARRISEENHAILCSPSQSFDRIYHNPSQSAECFYRMLAMASKCAYEDAFHALERGYDVVVNDLNYSKGLRKLCMDRFNGHNVEFVAVCFEPSSFNGSRDFEPVDIDEGFSEIRFFKD